MQISKLWIVTRPSRFSTLEDVCFEADFKRLYLQVLGGLNPDDVVGMYADKQSAQDTAKRLIHAQKVEA